MELFNKYKNKNFTYLTNYINSCLSDTEYALTAEELLLSFSKYNRFQKDEIVRNILFLGHYVKVISPQNITDEVISLIKNSYKNYC